jgi:hypothetical protein
MARMRAFMRFFALAVVLTPVVIQDHLVLTVRVRTLGIVMSPVRGRHPREGRSALERQDSAKILKTNRAL